MARPAKPAAERRDQTVRLRLSAAEWEAIRGRADRAELSVKDYLRRRALEGFPGG